MASARTDGVNPPARATTEPVPRAVHANGAERDRNRATERRPPPVRIARFTSQFPQNSPVAMAIATATGARGIRRRGPPRAAASG